MRALVVAAAVVALIAALVGTTRDAERERYLAANEALFEELPMFPGARVTSTTSSEYRESESGPVVGYTTLYLLDLPPETHPDAVAAFYERRLRPEWALVQQLDEPPEAAGPILDFRRGDTAVGINLESWRGGVLEISVDHDAG